MPNHQDYFGWSCSYYLALYVLSLHVLDTNTRSSPHWKLVVEESSGRGIITPNPSTLTEVKSDGEAFGPFLDRHQTFPTSLTTQSAGGGTHSNIPYQKFAEKGKVGNGSYYHGSLRGDKEGPWLSAEEEDELILQILATTVFSSRGSWTKNGQENYCPGCPVTQTTTGTSPDEFVQSSDVLDCGRPANFTYYDQLIGVANRQNHPHIPEPQVAMVFRKKGSKKDNIDLNTLEKKLRKAKKEKPSSVQLYNQIGNFWRIKGHTLRAIECFRRALAVAPNNPEVLHNLARLLLTLQYLDDALFLARRSLELQAPDRSAWQQHFTLGEILRAYGHHQEALLHFKHTLELRPDHSGAQDALRDLETLLAGTGLHICTLLIIIFLVLGVLLVMLSSLENEEMNDLPSRPPPRHFSRALAMRSLKLGISPRALRAKRFP